MKPPDSARQTPQTQRVIVTLCGASIFFASVISMVTSALKLEVPDLLVAIASFALGAATAAWVLRGTNTNRG